MGTAVTVTSSISSIYSSLAATGTLLLILALVPPNEADPRIQDLHKFMDDQEFSHYFGQGGKGDEKIDPTGMYQIISVREVTTGPVKRSSSGHNYSKHRTVEFDAGGNNFRLNLKRNSGLLAPQAMIVKRSKLPKELRSGLEGWNEHSYTNFSKWNEHPIPDLEIQKKSDDDEDTHDDDGVLQRVDRSGTDCHYLHQESGVVAAMSLCNKDDVRGLLLTEGHSLEVMPLNSRLKRMISLWTKDYNASQNGTLGARQPRSLHLMKRLAPSTRPVPNFADIKAGHNDDVDFDRLEGKRSFQPIFDELRKNNVGSSTERKKRGGGGKVVELGVFFDNAAYRRFSNYFLQNGHNNPDEEVKRLLLGYLNGIQAIYMLPSLGQEVKFSVVRMEIWTHEQDPSVFNHYNGDREDLLNSFCEFQEKSNPSGDQDPGHWDLAIYVSGLNFYEVDSHHRKNGVTMGLARVTGMCSLAHNCVIGEIGVTNWQGKPYPSAGFTAVYVMAHEIGHSLGMQHDHKAGCDRNGYIMSESRGTKGESKWSTCSVSTLLREELSCLNDNSGGAVESLDIEAGVLPGEVWSASRQCKIFLLDSDANIDHTESTYADMCTSIVCRSPRRDGYYRAGPALEGTACGEGKWCREGVCTANTKVGSNPTAGQGTWSDWSFTACRSGCTDGSVGYQTKRRSCNRGRLIHSLKDCRGPSSGIDFCPDSGICPVRKDTSKYASEQCAIFSSYVDSIQKGGEGVQVTYSEKRLWQSCAIYCKRAGGKGWYTPRQDLNDLPLSPFFPDGTLCHEEGGVKYYCQKNTCLEKDSRVAKSDTPDLNLLQNAAPEGDGDLATPGDLEKYFSLDDGFNTIGGHFGVETSQEPGDDDWVVDYLDA